MTGLSRTQRPSRLLVDAWESWNGLHSTSNNPALVPCDFRSSVWHGGSADAVILLASASGGTGSLAYDPAVGRVVQTWASGAGATSLNSNNPGTSFMFPMGKRFQLPAGVPVQFLPPLRRFRVDFLPRITVAGAAEVACGVSVDGTLIVTGNNPTAGWSSRPAVNAGRWMPRWRLVTGGPLFDGPDSLVAPAAFHQLSIVYEEGPVPRLRWLIDGSQVWELAGDAAQPEIGGGFQAFLGKAVGAPAGTTTQWAETRFRVEEM